MKKIFKRISVAVMALAVMLTVVVLDVPGRLIAAAATSGTCGDNLTWTLDDNGTLTISGNGKMNGYGLGAAGSPWLGSSEITSIVIENGVTSIGVRAFYNVGNLSSVTIADSVEQINNYGFYGCTSLEEISIPDSVTYIGSDVFRNCSKLRKITLPKDLIFISSYTFRDCTALESVNIPNSVTSVADYAFYNCSKLSGEIDIPSTVTKIGASAFYNCALITGVTVGGKTPPTLGTNAFEGTSVADIRVPCGAVDTYKNADKWSAYADIIKNDGHKADIHIAAKDTTCTEAGNDEYWTCGCGKYKYSDADGTTEITSVPVIPAPGHSWSNSWSGGGITHWHECTSCGDKKDEAAHSGGTATCRAKATCEICGEEYGDPGDHDYGTDWVTGDTQHWHECSVCGDKTDEAAHSGGTATCQTKAACEICGEEYGDPEDHDYGTDWVTGDTQHWHECTVCGDKTDTTDHTLEQKTDDTNHWQECSVCSYKKDETAHSWGAWSLTTKPTLTAPGAAERVCYCGKKQTKPDVPALSDIAPWKKDDTRHIDATEDNDGRDVYTSEYGEVEVTIPKLSHRHTLTQVPEVPATETTEGVKEHWHCDGCGKDFTDENGTNEIADLTIPVIGHKHTLVHVPEVPATETTEGVKEHWHCDGCGKDFTDENGTNEITDLTIPVIGHEHTLVHVPEVPATETTEGVKEHWHCEVCGKDFEDENGTKELTGDTIKIGKLEVEIQAPANVPQPEIATSKEELIAAALTEEEQKKVEEGTDIKIILKVEDASDSAPAEDKEKINTAIGGLEEHVLGLYLDITLLKRIGEQEEKITRTNALITITFEVPSELRGKAEYTVVRVHDGEITVLSDKDSDPDTITIETDRFSTYALTYREKAAPAPGTGGSGGSSGSGRRPHYSNSAPTETTEETSNSGDTPPTKDSPDMTAESEPTEEVPETVSGGEIEIPSSEDSYTAPSDESAPVLVDESAPAPSADSTTSSGEEPVPSDDTGDREVNPSTGAAVSLIPLAAVAVIIAAAKRKKK